MSPPADRSRTIQTNRCPRQKRGLLAACLAHALHDGYTDALYAFLPVWQAQFGSSYAALALVLVLRTLRPYLRSHRGCS